jgi:DNA-binding transcriptional MocR family regulator
LRQKAIAAQSGFQPGTVFSDSGAFAHCLRLSFAHYGEADITEGVQRLSRVIRSGVLLA